MNDYGIEMKLCDAILPVIELALWTRLMSFPQYCPVSNLYFSLSVSAHRVFMEVAYAYLNKYNFALTTEQGTVEKLP